MPSEKFKGFVSKRKPGRAHLFTAGNAYGLNFLLAIRVSFIVLSAAPCYPTCLWAHWERSAKGWVEICKGRWEKEKEKKKNRLAQSFLIFLERRKKT
eukprot:748729-Pelagomonas_calceolata.AAC.1